MLWGLDEQLVYHYLVSRRSGISEQSHEQFWSASGKNRPSSSGTDYLLSIHQSQKPARVLTTTYALGLDPRRRDLRSLRRWFAEQDPGRLRTAFSGSPMASSVNDKIRPLILRSALPLEGSPVGIPLLCGPSGLIRCWFLAGRPVSPAGRGRIWVRLELDSDGGRRSPVSRDWTRRIGPVIAWFLLPPRFEWPAKTPAAWLLTHAVLRHCREHGQPFAMMMGVKRAVAHPLRLAGDGMGKRPDGAWRICVPYPDNRSSSPV